MDRNIKVLKNSAVFKELTKIKCKDDIDIDCDFIATMKKIEESHWEYLDNLSQKYHLPRLNFYLFMDNLFQHYQLEQYCDNIKLYYRNYDKYKKSLPTAGGIILYDNNILLVRVYGSKIYSLPKGKSDNDEEPHQTAIREIREETGLDMSSILDKNTNYIKVAKTKLYIIDSDCKIKHFDGYNRNEIQEIRWFNLNTLVKRPNLFSKQTKSVRAKLIELNYV